MNKRGLSVLILSVLITGIFVVFASAEFSSGNPDYSIDKSYGVGSNLKGWINLSIVGERVDSLFKDSEENSITLMNLLNLNPDIHEELDYNCNPSDCEIGYSASNTENKKEFSLGDFENKLVGVKFESDLKEITSVSFDVFSDAPESCNNQIKINIAEDALIIGSNKSADSVCLSSERYGCFDANKTNFEYNLKSSGMYCQRMNIPETPQLSVGAWINQGSGDEITIELYKLDNLGDEVGVCTLPSGSGEEKSCEIDYAVAERGDYYVCISSKLTEASQIKGYEDSEQGCGFHHTGGEPIENKAFQFFVKGKMFATPGSISISNNIQGEDIADIFNEYIKDKYNSELDCSVSGGCIVPINIESKENQNILIENISVTYDFEDLSSITSNGLYDLTPSPATITTEGFQKIILDNANFSMPSTYGNFSYSLTLGGVEVFSDNIAIEKIPQIKSLSPLLTVSSFLTKLKVKVDLTNNSSISSYKWEIGDDVKTTTEPELIYTFPSIGSYDVKITVTDTKAKSSSKTFVVNVGSPSSVIDEKLTKMQRDLENITKQINSFPIFQQESIKQIINTEELSAKITELQQKFSVAGGEDDYNAIIAEILEMKVPEEIVSGVSTGSVSFYPTQDKVGLQAISVIAGGDYETTNMEEYQYSVAEWGINNIDLDVKYNQINAVYDGNPETLLSVFEATIKQKAPIEYDSYLFIKELENIYFNKDYGQETKSGYLGILLDSSQKQISFSTTEDIAFVELPMFVSPSLENVEILDISEGVDKGIKWALFILILFFLIMIGFVVYIILQHWYKTRYETYLFKNRNYLFNLIHYIDAQKKKGVKESEIFKKLKKSGWNSEQINYVVRKYLGKRTGMWEIPINKILGIFKRNKTIPPRQPIRGVPKPIQKAPIRKRFPNPSMNKGVGKKTFFKK